MIDCNDDRQWETDNELGEKNNVISMELWKYVSLSLSWALFWITQHNNRVDIMFFFMVLNLARKVLNFKIYGFQVAVGWNALGVLLSW